MVGNSTIYARRTIMKKSSRLALLLVSPLMLVGCKPKAPEKKVNALEEVIATLSEDFAFEGDLAVKYQFGEDSQEASIGLKGAVTSEYFYEEVEIKIDGDVDFTSFKRCKNDEGAIVERFLDPLSNTLEEFELTDYEGNVAAYNDYYGEMFKGTEESWNDDGKGTLTLLDFDIPFIQKYTQLFYDFMYEFDVIKVTYDVDTCKPTGMFASYSFADDEDPEFSSSTTMTFEGKFIDVKTVEIPGDPKPTPAQPGQDKLEATFEKLREGNFTVSYEYSDGGKTYTPKVYFTEDSYYFENVNDVAQEHPCFGAFAVEGNGYQKFYYEDGKVYLNHKAAYGSSTHDDFFSNLFLMSGYCFDVKAENEYTLSKESGLSTYISSILGPESLTGIRAKVTEGTFNLKLNSDGTVSYSYDSSLGTIKATISNIGTTVFPLDVSDPVPYVPMTSPVEYLYSQWIPEYAEGLIELAQGHDDELPFVEPGTAGDMSMRSRRGYDEETGDFLGEYVMEIDIVNMYTVNALAVQEKAEFDAIAQANPNYRYDEENDGYIYSVDGKDIFEVYGVIVRDYTNLWGQTYDSALVQIYENLDVPDAIKNW